MEIKATGQITLVDLSDGVNGADGKGIVSTTITYQAGTSGTQKPEGEWLPTVPLVPEGQFLWTKTEITYTSGKPSVSYSVSKMGENGVAGAAGNGIESTIIEYQVSASGVDIPQEEDNWKETIPSTSAETPFLWTRTTIKYTDGATSRGYSVGSTIEGVKVGGRNLIQSDFITWYIPEHLSAKDKSLFKTSGTITLTTADNVNTGFYYDRASMYKPNTSYVLTYYVTVLSGDIVNWGGFHNGKGLTYTGCFLDGKKVSNTTCPGAVVGTELQDNKKHKIVLHFKTGNTIPEDSGVNYSYIHPGRGNSGFISVQIDNFKLEEGNISTDWSPAPEDVNQTIKDAIDNIEVGGRNYALKTGTPKVLTGNNGQNQNSNIYDLSLNWQSLIGKEVTLSFDYEFSEGSSVTSGDTEYMGRIGMNSAPWQRWIFIPTPSISMSGHLSGTYTIPDTMTSSTTIGYRFDYFSGKLTISNLKFEIGNKPTDWTQAPEDTVTYIDNLVSDLQTQVDNKIQTYSQNTDPSSAWTTTELKTSHTGDLWYNPNTKLTKRWSGSAWVSIENAEAQSAAAIANTKAQVFTGTPTIPYYKGDLWITALNKTGVVKTCQTTRTTGSYTASDWVEGLKYTDDTIVNNLQIGGKNLLLGSKDFSGAAIKRTIASGTFNGCSYIDHTVTTNNNYYDILQWNNVLEPEPNQEYTLSFWAKGDIMMTSYFFPNTVQSGKNSAGSTTTSADGAIAVQLTSEWKRYWITWKTRSDVSGLKNVIVGRADAKRTGNVCIACPKFEKGNKPTDWTQAPEDVDKLLNKTIASTVEEYYWSNSNIIPSGGEWSENKEAPEWAAGLFLWKRNFITKTDGSTDYKPSENGYCISGLPKLTGDFEGEYVTITDSGNFTFPELSAEGNHTQEIRTEKNLFTFGKGSSTFFGVTTFFNNSEYTLRGTVTQAGQTFGGDKLIGHFKAGTYTLSSKVVGGTYTANGAGMAHYLRKPNREQIITYGFNKTITFTLTEDTDLHLELYVNKAGAVFEDVKVRVQIEASSTATSWQQKGAAPTITTPSDVEVCGSNVNLLEVLDGEKTFQGVTTIIKKGEISCEGVVTENYANINNVDSMYNIIVGKGETYVFSRTMQNIYSLGMILYNSDSDYQEVVIKPNSTETCFTAKANYKSCWIYHFGFSKGEKIIVDKFKVKIEKNIKKTHYTPYNQGSINISICNKNLAKLELEGKYRVYDSGIVTSVNGNYNSFIARVKPNTVYAVTNAHSNLCYFDKKKNFIKGIQFSNGEKTFNTNNLENVGYVTIAAEVGKEVQIEEGEIATDYIEYQEQTFPIIVQKTMMEGDYFDFNTKEEIHIWKKYIFTGDEQISKHISTSNNAFFIVNSDFKDALRPENNKIDAKVLSSHFLSGATDDLVFYDKKGIGMDAKANAFYICTGLNSTLSTVEDFKAWLKAQYYAGTPVYVYYKLETPQRLQLTEEQLKLVYEMKKRAISYKNITHIYSLDDINPFFNGQYCTPHKGEVELGIKNDLEQLKTDLSEVQSSIVYTKEGILSTVSQDYMKSKDAKNEISGTVATQIKQTSSDITLIFSSDINNLKESRDGLTADIKEYKKYIVFVDGKIRLCAEGSTLVLQIQNDKIVFLQSESEVAYFSNNKLYVTDGQFLNSLQLGNFAFKPRSNGSLSFGKVGG